MILVINSKLVMQVTYFLVLKSSCKLLNEQRMPLDFYMNNLPGTVVILLGLQVVVDSSEVLLYSKSDILPL